MVQHPEVLWAQRSSVSDAEKVGIFFILLDHYSDLSLEYYFSDNQLT